ncbi:MAG: restriction endonuclease [Synergistaceae bacterium]|nr:restriction endonuclease [Synergistaceae bacterium]
MNYWQHRIYHMSAVSYPLLDKGYLSIGFSDFLHRPEFLDEMLSDRGDKDKWEIFEAENKAVWGDYYRNRYNLWRFLCEFKIGDWVIVPSWWGTFSVYEITGTAMPAGQAAVDDLKDWSGKPVISDGRYLCYDEENIIDIGFVIPVKKIESEIPRNVYVQNALRSSMSFRGTNLNITRLSEEIKGAVERFRANKPINIYDEAVKKISAPLKEVIDTVVSNEKFEALIASYFNKIGADEVYIPSKQSGKGEADADIIAYFNALKLEIIVQAKRHQGETDERGVNQVIEYRDQEEADDGWVSIAWVITSGDKFSNEAVELAARENVRLIAWPEFCNMLLDAGISVLKF